jgi:hypothetical protein
MESVKMSRRMSDTCNNCGTGIGKLESPFVWKDRQVCVDCFAKLKRAETMGGEAIPYAQPATPHIQAPKNSRKKLMWAAIILAIMAASFACGMLFQDHIQKVKLAEVQKVLDEMDLKESQPSINPSLRH